MKLIKRQSEVTLIQNDPDYPKYYYGGKIYLGKKMELGLIELYMEVVYDQESLNLIEEELNKKGK